MASDFLSAWTFTTRPGECTVPLQSGLEVLESQHQECPLTNDGVKLVDKYLSFLSFSSAQFSRSVVSDSLQPMNCSTPGLPVHHQVPEPAQTHVHWVGNAIQPSHPLLAPVSPAFNLSQHQGLFKWISSLHHVTKVLEFQLQHQSFQWTLRTDLL